MRRDESNTWGNHAGEPVANRLGFAPDPEPTPVSMIPSNLVPTVLQVGPVSVQLFGTLVVTGVVVGHALTMRLATERGIDPDEMRGAAAWALVAGFVGAHFADVLIYRPDKLGRDGVFALLRLWDGISSWGGFTGALVGTSLYFRRQVLSQAGERLPPADAARIRVARPRPTRSHVPRRCPGVRANARASRKRETPRTSRITETGPVKAPGPVRREPSGRP